MDGNLRHGVQGADIVRNLRASGIAARILMFSSDDSCNEAGLAAGANGSWNKKLVGRGDWKAKFKLAIGA